MPLSTFTNAALIQDGLNDVQFTYLGNGQLRYDGLPFRFLITGAVSVTPAIEQASFDAELMIVINNVGLPGTGSQAFIDGIRLLVASAVRLLQTGDVVELGLRKTFGAGPAAATVLSVQTALSALGTTS